jgi:hypothetical protein
MWGSLDRAGDFRVLGPDIRLQTGHTKKVHCTERIVVLVCEMIQLQFSCLLPPRV